MKTSLLSVLAGICLITMGFFGGAREAFSLDLDWSGQFRSEFHLINNYGMDKKPSAYSYDATRVADEGYYIPSAGSDDANFTTLFLKLRPKVIVNDNVFIKSEWYVGDPIFGMFGNSAPSLSDQRLFTSTSSGGSSINMHRLWGEFITDFGTVQVGRAPLHYGLGIVWNNGDGLWDRYASTGDMVRLLAKFGSFTFSPAFINYTIGNTFAGALDCTTVPCTTKSQGTGSVNDYSIMMKYENADEDMEMGVNFIRRVGGSNQDNRGYVGPTGAVAPGFIYNTWDLYTKKRLGALTLGAEVPLISGTVAGQNYSTYGVAGEATWKPNDTWNFFTKLGSAPGQPNADAAGLSDFKAFYFHPNYHLGLIMFNYQFANFATPQTQNNSAVAKKDQGSPFDNPIANAQYLHLNTVLNAEKWRFNLGFVYARANVAAQQGKYFYNSRLRKQASKAATSDQSRSLGWELDFGTAFQWDDHFQLGWDLGMFFPGAFYKFSNSSVGVENETSMIFASVFKIGVNF